MLLPLRMHQENTTSRPATRVLRQSRGSGNSTPALPGSRNHANVIGRSAHDRGEMTNFPYNGRVQLIQTKQQPL